MSNIEPIHGAIHALKPNYQSLSDTALLDHFIKRSPPNYFPVIDRELCRPNKINQILDNKFEFNCETHVLPDPINWLHNPSEDIEWHIFLHKFYYAVGLGLAHRRTYENKYLQKWLYLINTWIEQTEPGFIASDVTGRRIQNWIYSFYFFVEYPEYPCVSASFLRKFLDSLYIQVNYLINNLAPSRNHRTIELYSIFLAAVVFPELQQSDEWLNFSTQELEKNIHNDFLNDGVHCELSTDYHHLALLNLLNFRRLALLNNIEVSQKSDHKLKKALRFAKHAQKPDGIVPSFSDGDARCHSKVLHRGYTIYQDEELRFCTTLGTMGTPPKTKTAAFPSSGYYMMRSGWGDKNARFLMCDCGPLGAGNHGHLDALSFEAAAYGRSLIVDPGRYTYFEEGQYNWRKHFRQTTAHNTVVINNENQTCYQTIPDKQRLRIVGPYAESHCDCFKEADDYVFFSGHVKSPMYEAIHTRKIIFIRGQYWLIVDKLTAHESHNYELQFQLSEAAQKCTTLKYYNQTVSYISPNLVLSQALHNQDHHAIKQGFVSYTYGKKYKAPIISTTCHAKNKCFISLIYPFKNDTPEIELQLENSTNNDALTVKIQIKSFDHRYCDHITLSQLSNDIKLIQRFVKSSK